MPPEDDRIYRHFSSSISLFTLRRAAKEATMRDAFRCRRRFRVAALCLKPLPGNYCRRMSPADIRHGAGASGDDRPSAFRPRHDDAARRGILPRASRHEDLRHDIDGARRCRHRIGRDVSRRAVAYTTSPMRSLIFAPIFRATAGHSPLTLYFSHIFFHSEMFVLLPSMLPYQLPRTMSRPVATPERPTPVH